MKNPIEEKRLNLYGALMEAQVDYDEESNQYHKQQLDIADAQLRGFCQYYAAETGQYTAKYALRQLKKNFNIK